MSHIGSCRHSFSKLDSHDKCNKCRACSRSAPCHICKVWSEDTWQALSSCRPYKTLVKGRLMSSGIPPVTSPSKVQLSKGAVSGSQTKSTAGEKHATPLGSFVSPQTASNLGSSGRRYLLASKVVSSPQTMKGTSVPSPSSSAPAIPSGLTVEQKRDEFSVNSVYESLKSSVPHWFCFS